MIDVQRLATDAGYWDSVAPKGATHYATDSFAPWERENKDGSGDYFCDIDRSWVNLSDHFHNLMRVERHRVRIPRPQSEWVDGLPGVGVECESATRGAGYRAGHITYVSDQILVWMDKLTEHEYATRPHDREFRPLPTKAQCDRDELVNLICGQGFLSKDGNVSWEIADAIIKAGWTKP